MVEALDAQEDYINVLLYGIGNTGKSTALAHMADLGKIVVINAEDGIKARALKKCGVNTANIELWPPKGGDITFESIEKEWLRIRETLHNDPSAYVGVIWDSGTEIQNVLLDLVRADAFKRAESSNKPRASAHFTDRADYGETSTQMSQLMRKFRDLPCHFGVSALERRDMDEDDGKIIYSPSFSPGLLKDIYLWFDLIGHTSIVVDEDTGDEEFRALFRAHGKYRGKDRYQATPRTLVEPTFGRILGYVDGSITLETDSVMTKAKAKAAKAKDTKSKSKNEKKDEE